MNRERVFRSAAGNELCLTYLGSLKTNLFCAHAHTHSQLFLQQDPCVASLILFHFLFCLCLKVGTLLFCLMSLTPACQKGSVLRYWPENGVPTEMPKKEDPQRGSYIE